MLSLRYARQTLPLLSPPHAGAANTNNSLFSCASPSQSGTLSSCPFSTASSSASVASSESQTEMRRADVANNLKEWFLSTRKPLFDRIFEILRTEEKSACEAALSGLNLQVSKALVLDVLDYHKKDFLTCWKFFEWAGRQAGFHHTRATFNAIFRIISKEELLRRLDLLQNDMEQRYVYKASYHSVLVVGYAVAGKPEIALHLFGKMRFLGVDLDSYAYHVLLDSLVEHGHLDVVETVAREIRERGFQNKLTHSIMIKSFCKQKDLERCAEYLHALLQNDCSQLSDIAIGSFVDALCKDNQFERAAKFLEEFQGVGLVSMESTWGVWIRGLVKAGKLDSALEFLKDKQAMDGYVPDAFLYNMLICRLLGENRLEEVYGLLMDMKEKKKLPDDVTMNAIACFLCKAGMMDIAMELYESRLDSGLADYLLGHVSADDAFRVLRNSRDLGYLLGQKTVATIADVLGRSGELDKMKELVLFTLDRDIMLNTRTYCKCISALCRAGRVEEGYKLHMLLNNKNLATQKVAYMDLVIGFCNSSKGVIAARLLVEMQERGYRPGSRLLREVISCLSESKRGESAARLYMEMQERGYKPSSRLIREVIDSLRGNRNLEDPFFTLLERQLYRHQSSDFYNNFIYASGHATRPELALQAYDMMKRDGIQPGLKSDILLLRSKLKGKRIGEALHLFRDLIKGRCNRKVWRSMIVGLCQAKEPEHASKLLNDMKAMGLIPSIECYEKLTKLYCDLGQYHKAISLVSDMTQMGRPISSFIGNVFLYHALITRQVYAAWHKFRREELTPACWDLGYLIGVFSGPVEGDDDVVHLERLIQGCFHVTTYTNIMILRKLCKRGSDVACKYFERLRERGYKPNKWIYGEIIHSLQKDGRTAEARIWGELYEEFHRRETARRRSMCLRP